MNPEFERNVWLELTPGRLIVMVAVLALAFGAAVLMDGFFAGPSGVARFGYYVIVVIWGTRNAARSVVGEIRDRTWDGQRLSSLPASTMMWGKLFGSTIFNWVGGAICLTVIMADVVDSSGIVVALIQLAYYLALGVIAQAASLLASLIAVGRRQGRAQFEVFLYQAAGLLAAIVVWAIADPTGSSFGGLVRPSTIVWWGQGVPSQPFLLLSLAVFTGWMLTGCYRRMRLELKLRNGPLVWLAFLLFIGAYVAGFDAWLSSNQATMHLDPVARRLFLAFTTYAVLGYVMAFLEPKDRVRYRWLGSELGKFHLGTAFSSLQGWMMSYLAALLMGVALLVNLGMTFLVQDQSIVTAMLGFLSRDMAIIVLMNMLWRKRGGDFAALCILILLYALLPSIFAGLHFETGRALFMPRPTEPIWFSPLAAWAEAVLAWAIAVANIALPEERAQASDARA
jgi:hypothetical protein